LFIKILSLSNGLLFFLCLFMTNIDSDSNKWAWSMCSAGRIPRLLSPNSCPIKTKVEHRWSNPPRLGTPVLAQSNLQPNTGWNIRRRHCNRGSIELETGEPLEDQEPRPLGVAPVRERTRKENWRTHQRSLAST